jgi:cytosine/adenosine deaminase-related metal-dependent hydrolase
MPIPSDKGRVFFFDLYGTLVADLGASMAPVPGIRDWMMLAGSNRLGVLCNLRPGLHLADLRLLLDDLQLRDFFDPTLLLAASDLPVALSDPRAFLAAAALAGRPPSDCSYVSANPALLEAARSAGFQAVAFEPSLPEVTLSAAEEEETVAVLAAARRTSIVVGPDFILRGRIVTMDDHGSVIPDGRLVISKGKIVHVLQASQPVPKEFAESCEVNTGATLYPGMLDLHNHFAYNAIPLWEVPQAFTNRSQWPRYKDYKPLISLPTTALAAHADTAKALARYVETKAVMGGITTGQGIKTRVNGGPSLFRGAMRTVEQTDDDRLPQARTNVLDLYVKDESKVLQFRKGLEQCQAYFYHLSEGIDDIAYQHYEDLVENELIQSSLVGIHSLALKPADLTNLEKQSAKVVWSPFSNLLLYGKTLDLKALLASKVRFSIGCDWAPTGSKNLLQEMKIARFEAKRQKADLDDETLVRAVTCWAAEVVAWEKWLGVLREDGLADIVAIHGTSGDPYSHLIDATEVGVDLVVVNGIPRYGDADLMDELCFDKRHPLEKVKIAGKNKSLYLYRPDDPEVTLTYCDAVKALQEAMSDLPAFVQKVDLAALADPDQPPAFVVELDMDPPVEAAPGEAMLTAEAALAADFSKIADSIPLDAPEVGADDYWQRLKNQHNLPDGLEEELENAYK